MPAQTPAEVKNIYNDYRQRVLRIDEEDCIGPRDGMPSLEDKARAAASEGRHQDAIDAYSLALCYGYVPRILGERSEIYLKANNARLAYIDACEALRLNDILRDADVETKNLLTDYELSKALYCKALSLEGLGLCEAARITLCSARIASVDPVFIVQVEIAEETLVGKKDSPLVSESFLTDYNPLESDSQDFGREFFLGDVNRFVLNNWKQPSASEKQLEFDFTRWKTITSFWREVVRRFDKLNEESPVNAAAMIEAGTIGLCFSDDFWLDRAEMSDGKKDPLFSYINATEAYKHAIRTNCYASLSSCAWIRASALYRAGHFQQARKTLEPALRLSVGTPTTKVEKLYSDILRRSIDAPNSEISVFDAYDPLYGHGYCADLLRRVRPGLIGALEKIYGDDFSAMPKDVANRSYPLPDPLPNLGNEINRRGIANDERLMGLCRLAVLGKYCIKMHWFSDARRLFTVLNALYERRDPDVLCYRAQSYLFGKRPLEAFIDASESLKLNPRLARAYEVQAVALCNLGHEGAARTVIRRLRRNCPEHRSHCCISRRIKAKTYHGRYPRDVLENYDPEFADYFGDGPLDSLTAEERREVGDTLDFEEAVHLVQEGHYEKALERLVNPLQTKQLPYSLTLRATCYLETAEGNTEKLLKAYADATKALKLDPYFQDAMLLKSKTLVSLGLYSHARKSIQSYGGYAMERTTGAIILRAIAGKTDDPVVSPEQVEDLCLDDGELEEPATLASTEDCDRLIGRIERWTNNIEHHFGEHSRRQLKANANLGLYQRIESALEKASNRLDAWEAEKERLDRSAKAIKDRLNAQEDECRELQNELKVGERSRQHLRKQLNLAKDKLLRADLPTATLDDFHKLKASNEDKDKILRQARDAYESLENQNHELKQQLSRIKSDRKAEKSQRKASNDILAQLNDLKESHEIATKTIKEYDLNARSVQDELNDLKRRNLEHKEATYRLEKAKSELETKLSKSLEQTSKLDKELKEKREENAELLSQLVDISTVVEHQQFACEPNFAGVPANSGDAQTSDTILAKLRDAVYATLFSRVEGYEDVAWLLRDLMKDAGIDGEEVARQSGFASFTSFLKSSAMSDKVEVVNIYKAVPDDAVRHLREAQATGAEYRINKRIREAVNIATNRLKEELARKRTEADELSKQVRCPICMVRVNGTTFLCRDVNTDMEFVCGHVTCLHCSEQIGDCHTCRNRILSRVQFYL